MCGICGVYAPKVEDKGSVVARMNRALVHRGPDDAGQFTDQQCGIAMRRLAIIDLCTGHQPISNEDDSLHIVFNGEIYNYSELRNNLRSSGRHVFRTNSDTEVILHLYEEQRENTPKHLCGMFSFCIYDSNEKSFFIARDRFGEKPLFYSVINADTFAFSSEITSLLEFEQVQRKFNYESLYYYLRVGYLPPPLTMFSSIRELPAGHWLLWKAGVVKIEAYYTPEYTADPSLNDKEEAAEAVRESLLKAVRRQMVSDVPLGAFLSGGIDSSSVVAAMQRQTSQRVKTFTVRFEHAPYDESRIARQVAEHLGTDHHEFIVTNEGFDSEDLWRILRHVGQPFTDSSAIPTYLLSRQVREHVTVALSGDGGDEMFAGYSHFQECLKVDQLANAVPKAFLTTAGNVLHKVSGYAVARSFPALRKLTRAAHAACLSHEDRSWSIGPLFEDDEMQALVSFPARAQWQNGERQTAIHRLLATSEGMTRLRQLMDCRVRYFLASDMLVKVDRMSMAASLEVRAPMLDVNVAALSMKLPDHLLIHNGVSKYILREAVRDWLPECVFSHPKQGFSIPLHMFQNRQYQQLCEELLLGKENILLHRLFNRHALETLVQRGLNRKQDASDISVYRASHQIWSLLNLAGWIRLFKVDL